MNRIRSIICLLPIFWLTGCGLEFEEFSAPDGSYRVKLPGKPNKVVLSHVPGDLYEVRSGKWIFGVGMSNLPPKTVNMEPARALSFHLQEITNNVNGSIRSQSPITLNGFPGIEAECAIPPYTGRTGKPMPAESQVMRLYLVNKKLGALFVTGDPSIGRDTPEVRTFLDSFVLNVAPVISVPNGMSPNKTNTAPTGSSVASNSPSPPGTGRPSVPGNSATSQFSPGKYSSGDNSSETGTNSKGTDASLSNSSIPGTYNTEGTKTPPSTMSHGLGARPSGGQPIASNSGFNQLGIPRQLGNQITYTGTRIERNTKLLVGEIIQANTNGQWIDVRVMRISPDGTVQIRTQSKPFLFDYFPRMALQFAPGTSPAALAAADTPKSFGSSTPDSTSTSGLPKSLPKSQTGQVFPNSTSSTKSGPGSKEAAAGTGSLSLEGASIDALLKIIANKTEHRRVAAAEKLAEDPAAGTDPEVAQKLTDLLKVEELTVRAAVARALEKWATPEVVEQLLKHLTGGTAEVRQSIMRILADHRVESAITGIAQRVLDQEDRKVAIESLILMGESAQTEVLKLLSHQDSKVKLAACEILKEIGTRDRLVEFKKITDSWVGTERVAARKVLQAIESRK